METNGTLRTLFTAILELEDFYDRTQRETFEMDCLGVRGIVRKWGCTEEEDLTLEVLKALKDSRMELSMTAVGKLYSLLFDLKNHSGEQLELACGLRSPENPLTKGTSQMEHIVMGGMIREICIRTP